MHLVGEDDYCTEYGDDDDIGDYLRQTVPGDPEPVGQGVGERAGAGQRVQHLGSKTVSALPDASFSG